MTDVFLDNLNALIAKNRYLGNNYAFVAANYALGTGGKRFRYRLSLDTAKTFGGADNENALRLALAVELIHNYSLVHDDLPCMDNADMRRGQLSCQKKFGAAQATLAGDGLLNLAAEIVLGGSFQRNYLKAAEYLFDCAGLSGMIYGQSVDVQSKELSFEEYCELARLKTSKLICASVVPQAILGNAEDDVIDCLREYCEKLGLIYQFVDDMADKDEDDKKSSVLSYFDRDYTKKYILQSAEYIKNLLNKINAEKKFDFLLEFTDDVISRI